MKRRDFFKRLIGVLILPWVKPDFEFQEPPNQNQPEVNPTELIDNQEPIYYNEEEFPIINFTASGSAFCYSMKTGKFIT